MTCPLKKTALFFPAGNTAEHGEFATCVLKRTVAVLFMLILTGCGIPLIPVPIVKFAPHTGPLTEKTEVPLVETTLKSGHNTALALRSGRVRALPPQKTDEELLASLPSADLKQELVSTYVPPYRFKPLRAGATHYFNFEITPDFEQATALYLEGKAEEAAAMAEKILEDPKSPVSLLWQTSYLKAQVLLMLGRPDLAEKETVRTERYELEAMKGNHTARALRAEIKYWSGDLQGAAEDAAQVINAFGQWRFPATFSTPPLDQVELARCTTAQVRANIVLGLVLIAKNRHREALPWLELANQTMNNVMFTARHPITGLYFYPPEEIFWGRGMSLVALGNALLTLNPDSQRAGETFNQAREYFDALGFKAGNAVIETFKAHALSTAGHHAQAEQQAQKGIVIAEALGLMDYIWRLETIRGKALFDTGRIAEAEPALRRAQTAVDLMAGTMTSDDSKVRFGIGKEVITHYLARIDILKGNMAQLFEDLERGRARSFVSLLANRTIAVGREQETIENIRAIDRRIQYERQRKNALSSKENGEADRERILLEERLALIAALRERDPELAAALSVSTVDLGSVRKKLRPGDVMAYMLPPDTDNRLYLMLITNDRSELKTLKSSLKSIRSRMEEIDSTRKSRTDNQDARSITLIQKKTETEQAVSTEKAALALLQKELETDQWGVKRSLYIVPSGDFHFIPWGALELNHPVAVLPTGGWLLRQTFEKKQLTVASVLGDPHFGGQLPQLDGARVEALEIAAKYGVKPIIGQNATEAALRGSVGEGVGTLHLATHALYDPYLPLQSALILTDGSKAVSLTAARLFERPLYSRLVVLSACETGMGKVAAGDDLLGLTRSFYLGGTVAVLSSLWPVDDAATRLFMETFHDNSMDGDYGGAWLAARNRLRDQGYPPSIYGAFILGGSLGEKHLKQRTPSEH